MSVVSIAKGGLVLAVRPSTKGMGWVAFEAPFIPYDWGLAQPRKSQNVWYVRRFQKLLSDLEPEVLVVEESKRPGTAPCPRIERLYKALVALAVDRGIAVARYSRKEVQACFAPVGAVTRQEIAEAVARHIAVFESLAPPARRPWEAQHRHLSLFSAAALAMTHYQRDRLISPEEYLAD